MNSLYVLLHLFLKLFHKHCSFLSLWAGCWLKWKSAYAQGCGGRSERERGGLGQDEASWLMFCGWSKLVVLDRMGCDNQRCWLFDQQAWYWRGEVLVSCIAQSLGGWWYWMQGDWHPIRPKPVWRQPKPLSSGSSLPVFSSNALLTQSVGGAVNNVATRKINCEQAAGLGGAFWGQASLKRARLVIFHAGQEMRQAGVQL